MEQLCGHCHLLKTPRFGQELHKHYFILRGLFYAKYQESLCHCITTSQMYHCFFFVGLYLWQMEVPRLEPESKLQLPVYTAATATPDPSHIFQLHHSLQQRRILNH